MRLEYYITEKINLNKPVNVTQNDNTNWESKFTVGKEKYEFSAFSFEWFDSKLPEHQDIRKWEIQFETSGDSADIHQTGRQGPKALEVFSYVASSFAKFIKDKHPKYFEFGADKDEPSRIKLYDRLAKMVAKKFKYKLAMGSSYGDKEYYFERK